MKMVFIAGPYRAPTEWEVVQNIRRAESIALSAWQIGASVICPHKNTAHFGGSAPDRIWLAGALEQLRRCDAVLCVPGWEKSEGAKGEIALAQELGIPVFTDVKETQTWLASHR